jgi:uracil-DNA glycosylase family 4
MADNLSTLQQTIISCNKCPRLRKHCQEVSQIKRKAYQNQIYWGKPIPGFGDPHARLFIVGLAPGAHGANRTGRVLTGDRSGDWLYRALHKAGFANQAESTHAQDGLELNDAYVSCVVKCAPPDNKPDLVEQKMCTPYLNQELRLLPTSRVWIALGQIALQGLWPLLEPSATRPPFKHGVEIPLSHNRWLLLSYHPSQQNTFTKRLTEPMFDSIFSRARELLS